MLFFPKYATDCITVLNNNGFDAYFVGGCVRDGLLGKKCDDIDITTNALPEEIMAIFPHSIPTGIKHGTVTVIFDEHKIEITTFRQEKGYTDNRHPDKVSFVSTLEEDLSRRDFTINSLACTKNGKIIDLFGGVCDLKTKLIKTVGHPEKRFDEDALRILRAYRFASTLHFKIDKNTADTAKKLANNINNLSGERVLKELIKTAAGLYPSVILEIINTGALENFGIISPKVESKYLDDISSLNLDDTSKFALFLSLFYHDVKLIKSKLRASNELINLIIALEDLSSLTTPKSKKDIKLLLFKHGYKYVKLYFYYVHLLNQKLGQNLLDLLDEIEQNKEVYCLKQLAINGEDLENNGFTGPEIKTALEKAMLYVIENGNNSKESILNFLKN